MLRAATLAVLLLSQQFLPGLAAEEVEASADRILLPGQKVADYDKLRFSQPYILQRLSERSYWLAVGTANIGVVVGDRGVMVFDALSFGQAKVALNAIATITDLPVTTLVYSHSHLDHVGDASLFVEHAASQGRTLRIVASEATVAEIERHGKPLPPPTDVITVPTGRFSFEGIPVDVYTNGKRHSPDSSIFHLPTERHVYSADLFVPGVLPFEMFDFSTDVKAYEDDLRLLLELEWDFFNDGHGNIGSPADAEYVLQYIDDVRTATWAAIPQVSLGDFVEPGKNRYVYMMEWVAAVTEIVREQIGDKYSAHDEFDILIRNHVMFLVVDLFVHGKGPVAD